MVPDNKPTEREPSILVADAVVFAQGHVLLILRRNAPFEGAWALPGGHVEPGETFADAAARELLEETGIVAPQPFFDNGMYDDPARDPRGHVRSMVYSGVLPEKVTPTAGGDAANAMWVPVDSVLERLVPMAFDHERIVRRVACIHGGRTRPAWTVVNEAWRPGDPLYPAGSGRGYCPDPRCGTTWFPGEDVTTCPECRASVGPVAARSAATSFICPACDRRSSNPNDVTERYCGACHWWTGDPTLAWQRPGLFEAHAKTPPLAPDGTERGAGFSRWGSGGDPVEPPDPDLDSLTRAELSELDGSAAVVADVLDEWIHRVVDPVAGHGVGLFLELLAAAGYRVTAIDPGPPLGKLLPPPVD